MRLKPLVAHSTVLLLTTFLAAPAIGATNTGGWWLFENRGYYEPLHAEIRAAGVRVAFPALSRAFPFSQSSGQRLVWDITMGKEIPVVGFETAASRTAVLPAAKWGWGVWLPVGFHMIEDLKDPSGPILNVDYRFCAMAKFQWALSSGHRVGLRLVPIGHESTHIGDEYTIAARRLFTEFDRINVSYEWWESGISFERVADTDAAHHSHTVFRVGTTGLWSPIEGFYSTDTTETRGRLIHESSRPCEPYAGIEYWRDEPSGTLRKLLRLQTWGWFVSAEARHRVNYDYRKASREERENAHGSFNGMLGMRNLEQSFNEKGVTQFALRYYYGVNPHGQFRSQYPYTLIALVIQVPV